MSGARPPIVLATLGTAGDLHPFLAIARALQEAGEPVCVLSQAAHRAAVEARGLPFTPIAELRASTRCFAHPKVWHPIDGLGVFWRHLLLPALAPTVEALRALRAAHPQAPLPVLAGPLVLGARLLAEADPGLRLLTAATAPMALRSLGDPLCLGAWTVPRAVPRALRRLLWAGLDRWKLDPLAAPALNAWRAEAGLPKLGPGIFGDWLPSPRGVLGLYPADFGPPPEPGRAWPVEALGFPRDEPGPPPAALAPDGPPGRIVAYPGSVPTRSQDALAEAAWALAAAGRPLVWIGAPPPAWAGRPRPAGLRDTPWTALPQALAGAALFVHHGGIGATAQGLAAGLPQVLLPSAYDQFDNAERYALGLGPQPPRWALRRLPLRERLEAALAAPPPARAAPDPADYSWAGAPNAAVRRVVERLRALRSA
ncbi:glycosyltransferase [Piscinibacter sp. Jin2]|uniref:Glycosyltransferase n=1 Tax=Aquariibacter lacus TaxID=2801332 RepID=A0A9X1BMY7_9BURK|nr:glycosyltransferase [Piscinibacter lacus]